MAPIDSVSGGGGANDGLPDYRFADPLPGLAVVAAVGVFFTLATYRLTWFSLR